jgi:putative zinc finger protein
MKCEEVQILIEDYVDSALDQKAIAFVKSHMTECSACTSFYQGLSREQEIYARYERDIEVTPALWASIESRIKQERIAPQPGLLSRLRERFAGAFAAPRLSPAFAAALVMIAIGITVGVMTFLDSRGSQTEIAESNRNTPTHSEEANPPKAGVPAPESPKPAGTIANNAPIPTDQSSNKPLKPSVPKKNLNATAVLTPAQLVRDAEQKYLTAISMLSRDVNRQRSQLDPMLLARLDASLSEIDRTIKETRRVVRENPGDPIALQYLLAAYSKKVEVLRGMTTD